MTRRHTAGGFRLPILALALTLACVCAAPAGAAVVTFDTDTADTTYTAGAGEVNRLQVRFTTLDHDETTATEEIDVIEFYDWGATITSPSAGYCTEGGEHVVYCQREDSLNALATINLGDGDDILREGTPGRDAAYGGPGDDLLVGRNGDDLIDGGPGDDTLEDPEWSGCHDDGGSRGADTIVGGTGTDELKQICRTGAVHVSLDGQANDGVEGEGDNVAGDIEIIEGTGNDDSLHFVGNDLPNVVNGGGAPNTLIGNGGDDKLYGGVDSDTVDGGAGNDVVEGWGGSDTVIGGPGTDDLSGEGGSTMSDGTGGADTILARDGEADTISCGTRADRAVVDQFDLLPQPGFEDTCEAVERESVEVKKPETEVKKPEDEQKKPEVVADPPPVLTVASRSARLKAGAFRLTLRCTSAAACAGKVSVRTAGGKKRRALGSKRFAIAAGGSKALPIALNRTGRKLARRGRTLKVVVSVKLDGRPAQDARVTLRR